MKRFLFYFNFLVLLSITGIISSCSSDKPIAIETPVVELVEITTVTRDSALVTYNVTGLELLSHGVRYATNLQDLKNQKLISASDGKVSIGDLNYNTLYYIQAFATNVLGSSQSEVMSFITSGPSSFMEFENMQALRDYIEKYPLAEPELQSLAIGGELSESDYMEIGDLGGQGGRFPNLSHLELSQVQSIAPYSFAKTFSNAYRWLTGISAPMCLVVERFAFMDCQALVDIELPMVNTLESFSLYNIGLKSFSSKNFPSLVTLEDFALASADISSIQLPTVKNIGSVLQGATNLQVVELGLEIIPEKMMAFSDGITELGEGSFPVATSIGRNAFEGCTSLKRAHFPSVNTIGSSSFSQCDNLTQLRFDADILEVDPQAFQGFDTQECILFINSKMAESVEGSLWLGKNWKAIFIL
ncbi:leucine-rich repeat protein [Myroides sp. LJL119]